MHRTPDIGIRVFRARVTGMVTAIALLACGLFVAVGGAQPVAASFPVVSLSFAPGQLTVHGSHFTPGGQVSLLVYRTVAPQSPTVGTTQASPAVASLGSYFPGGTFTWSAPLACTLYTCRVYVYDAGSGRWIYPVSSLVHP